MALSISIVKFVKFSREYFMYRNLSVLLLNCTAYKSLCLAKYASFWCIYNEMNEFIQENVKIIISYSVKSTLKWAISVYF